MALQCSNRKRRAQPANSGEITQPLLRLLRTHPNYSPLHRVVLVAQLGTHDKLFAGWHSHQTQLNQAWRQETQQASAANQDTRRSARELELRLGLEPAKLGLDHSR